MLISVMLEQTELINRKILFDMHKNYTEV